MSAERSVPWYALMRAGVHLCGGWAVGPVMPIYSQDHTWPEDLEWSVLHDAGVCMLVQFSANQGWMDAITSDVEATQTHASPDLGECFAAIIRAAQTGGTSVGEVNAAALLESLGVTPAEAAALDNPGELVWLINEGLALRLYPSLLSAVRAGFRP